MESFEFLIPLVLVAIHYILSSRKLAWLGSIIPIMYIILMAWLLQSTELKLFSSEILPFTLGFTILLGIWIGGRESYKKKQKEEIKKMESKDLQ